MNLITTVNKSSAQTSNIPNGIHFNYVEIKDTYCSLALSETVLSTKQYIFSFDVLNLPTSSSVSFGWYKSGMLNIHTIKPGHNSYVVTGHDSNSITFDDTAVTIPAGSEFDIVNFRLEELSGTNNSVYKNGIIYTKNYSEYNSTVSLYNTGNSASNNLIEY